LISSHQTDLLQTTDLISPDWPAPPEVKAFFTTRAGGVSEYPYAGLNLGAHVGDDPVRVAENRSRLQELLPAAPVWLNQVHGVNVVSADLVVATASAAVQADASVTTVQKVPCTVLVADCLPVLFCAEDASCVGVAHAGWRGLHRGVLERTVVAMRVDPAKIMAWLGPAIGPRASEVGQDVLDAFTSGSGDDAAAFRAIVARRDKYFADIYKLARRRLQRAGVQRIFGGQFCTVSEPARFFSYRRDGNTGRMAGLIWLE
jgi:polyphenol oxidase